MKKIILKKSSEIKSKSPNYKINYALDLNKSQYDAVMHNEGAALVIAGAGTGKTRTLVYRLARLIEDGNNADSILLLTFTRKASQEMIRRASILLGSNCDKIDGGTFHSFASLILRKYAKAIGYDSVFNIVDQSDSEDVINLIRTKLDFSKSKKRFPQKSTLIKIHSLMINTQSTLKEILEKQFPHFLEFEDQIDFIFDEYAKFKQSTNLMDYDDLLVNLLKLLKTKSSIRNEINSRYKFIMVDEYQDSNRLQHEIVMLLAGSHQNIMAVGDDSQSIYSFRGANFQNILFFPKSFENCTIYKIEENYRSSEQILALTNEIIKSAIFKYDKELYSNRIGVEKPAIVSAKDERQQSEFVAQQILQLHEEGIPMKDIAVLFRSSFHSFDLEIELDKSNIQFVKFGGMKFIEAAHVKDLLAYVRIIFNPKDAISWQRILLLQDGIGPVAASKIIELINQNKISLNNFENLLPRKDNLIELFSILSIHYKSNISLGDKCALFAEHYRAILKNKYADWQKRWKDIESFLTIAERYNSISTFLNDMAIDPPSESLAELEPESKEDDLLTLSTIHSAKGLEWKAVFLIWALEGKFPSAKSVDDLDSVEEERRLFYVACTRAKDYLFISHPTNIFDRESGFVMSEPSRFIANISEEIVDKFIIAEEEE